MNYKFFHNFFKKILFMNLTIYFYILLFGGEFPIVSWLLYFGFSFSYFQDQDNSSKKKNVANF